MTRLFASLIILCVPAFVSAQEPEHRPVRPKGWYFTPDQLQRALEGANQEGVKPSDQPKTPLSENAKSLVDFAKNHPEMAKTLIDAARDLARNNPDLFQGDKQEAAKKLAEKLGDPSMLRELMKNLDKKPPPSNVKRKPSEESDDKGRRQRNQQSKETDPNEQPQPDSKGRPERMPDRNPLSELKQSPKATNPLTDLAGQSPDFTESVLDQAKKRTLPGTPPTDRAINDAISRTVKQFERDPDFKQWLNDPMTKEKIQSPEFPDEIRKEIARQAARSNERSKEASEETQRSAEHAAKPEEQQRDAVDPRRGKPTKDQQESPERKETGESNPASERKNWMESVFPRKKSATETKQRPDSDQAKSTDQPESQSEKQRSSQANQLADMLKQNPGLVESLLKAAGENQPKENPTDGLRGIMEALKGTGLEEELRGLAKELNKDGSLNDLLKGNESRSQTSEGSIPRNRRRDDSGAAGKSARDEASKAFKELAGEDFNAGSLGETMKSLGEAMKKSGVAGESERLRSESSSSSRASGEAMGEGWLGMLGRGASKVGEWGAKASQQLSENVAPNMGSSRINPPSFGELQSMSMPSAEAGGKALLVVGILAAAGFGVYLILRRKGVLIAGGPLAMRLPRLSLAGMSPREQAAALFERAALERLGEPARPKHHVALAEKLCHGASSDSQKLAGVYEAARYAPPSEPFEPGNVGVVRDVLGRQPTGKS